jgi:hypothetical protein
MKRLLSSIVLLLLIGMLTWSHTRGGRVTVLGPEGTPVAGARVSLSDHSAPALLQGVTDGKGRAEIPAKRVRRGGWQSIIVSWNDPQGSEYVGENFDDRPDFPIQIQLSKRKPW